MEEQILQIVKELTSNDEIDCYTDLIKEDILDSLAFIELIEELEDVFNIEIQPTQVPSDTWRSVKNITEMVRSKR